jgi:hypothetical protein
MFKFKIVGVNPDPIKQGWEWKGNGLEKGKRGKGYVKGRERMGEGLDEK